MPDFDLSLVVRGKDEGASATGQKVASALDRLTAAEERHALASAKARVTADNLKASYSTQQAAIARLAAMNEKLAAAEANAAAKAVAVGSGMSRSRANLANFGQQIQDITQQAALGVNGFTILIQQGGQLAYSLNNVGGVAGKVARFFSNPFGSILIATAGIIGMLALRSSDAAKAQEDLGDMADYVGRAQSALGKVIDLVTGKFSNQNIVLREAIRLQAILAQQQAFKDAQKAGSALGGAGGFLANLPGFVQRGVTRHAYTAPTEEFNQLVAEYRANASASFTDFRRSIDQMAAAGRLKGLDVNQVLTDALKVAVARADYRTNKDIVDVIEGRVSLPDYLRRPGPKPKKPPKEKKPKDPFGVEEFGRDAADRIAALTRGFVDTPAQIDRVNQALRQLDDLVDDISHKKPPNMKELLADAERARSVIQDGLNKPWNDFLLAQQQSLEVSRLIASGHQDEADALLVVQRLEKEMGPLTQQRKDAVLATVQAMRYEQRQAEILQQQQQKYLDLLNEVKDAIHGVFEDPIKGLKDLPGRLIGAVRRLKEEKLFEQLFGDTFRALQDRITGTQVAEDAAAKMAVAVDEASAANRRATSAVLELASAASGAAGALQGVDPLAPLPDGTPGGPSPYGPEIVVSGRRPTDLPTILQKLAKGVGISDEGAKKIGQLSGKAFSGAATGQIANEFLKPLGKMLGFRTSNTGAQVGGAIGSLTGIPGGDIIGSIIGSVIGGLFKSGPKKGSATITNVYDSPVAKGSFKEQTTALAESIQGGLLQIAESLGGSLGGFAVSIGYNEKKKKYVVDTAGLGRLKSGDDITREFESEQEAIVFAIMDAIRDGAVQGLSDAVKKALGRYSDVDRSLREALKVQQLEDLIGGIGGSLTRVFKQFDTEAAERVRLAKDYGLDLVTVERINAEQRTKLVDDLLKQRLGALQDLQKSILYGDLYEGDAATRRSALIADITKVTADAEAGVEGATDQLADLYRQLLGTSKEAYGTAGPEYAADRDLVTSGLDHIIQVERDRIQQASAYQEATLAAANTNNALTNETNSLLAEVNGQLATLIGLSGGGAFSGQSLRFSTGRAVSL